MQGNCSFVLVFADEKSKVGLLKSLPNANTGLVLFKADIYDPNDFQAAIEGCSYVLHLATPLQEYTFYKCSYHLSPGQELY